CPAASTLKCAPPSGTVGTILVNVTDADGDRLLVVWTVNGTVVQTNVVPGGGPPTSAQVDLTALFPVGTNQLTVSVSDPSGCVAVCSTTVTVQASSGPGVTCAAPITLKCAPPTGSVGTVSANVTDAA